VPAKESLLYQEEKGIARIIFRVHTVFISNPAGVSGARAAITARLANPASRNSRRFFTTHKIQFVLV